MPQLQFADYAPQLVWLVISFVTLYLLMARVALPRIGNVIEQRRDRIARDLDEAERSRQETAAAIAAYETSMAEARARAHEIAQANRDKLTAELDGERAKVDAAAAAKTREAETAIAAAKGAALGDLASIAEEVTAEIVSKLIGSDLSGKKITAAVSAAMNG